MTKNKKGNFRSSKNSNQLRLRNLDEDEQYAETIKAQGDGQFSVQILNGPEEIAKLKGSMRKGKNFDKVNIGDMVLVQLDPTTTGKDKYYIIHKYSQDEKKQLEKLGELKSVVEKVSSTFIWEGEEEENETKEQDVDADFIKGL